MPYQTPRAREGNRIRCKRWRAAHRDQYNAYLRAYRARKKEQDHA